MTVKEEKKEEQLLKELARMRRRVAELEEALAGPQSMWQRSEYAESIVETVREPLVVLDAELHVLSASRSFYRTFQVAPEETVGELLYDLGNGQWEIPALRELLEDILPGNTSMEGFEVEHEFEAIGQRTMLLNARRIYRETNKTEMILLAIEDVTERKRAEEAVLMLNRELEEKNAEMEQFAYTVSHDLKSPLVTIRGFIGHVQRDVSEGRMDRVADYSQRIDGATGRMSRLIDNLLDLSRIGRVAAESSPIPLAETIQRICRTHGEQLADRGITVAVQEAMPTIYGDEERIGEVFDNLITNAIRYGCDAEDPRIEIGAEDDDNKYRIFVRDNGQGIRAEQHDKIFGLFQRLHPGKDSTGVGLAIVRRIVEVHGGRVWVESSPGSGATFWVEFPAGRGTPELAAPLVLEQP
jgi:two-component system CheB/CheR fusion protein